MKKTAGVSVCMIIKDEEEFLERCLLSVKDFADQIVIVDTGSTDSSISIAEKYGAQVFCMKWRDDFSCARNYSISKATGDWILLLDADEIFEQQDIDLFYEYINTTKNDGCHFTILNYIGRRESSIYTMHNAFRLLRNNGEYHFEGAIHEQIRRKDGSPIEQGAFGSQKIRLHHYGYLDEVVKNKQKRKRNLPLLLKELEKDPESPFLLFNLANEYLATAEHEKALELFDKGYANIDITQAYAPHLVFRRAVTLYSLGRYVRAIKALEEGLEYYPTCTDLEFLRGSVYAQWGRYTLAIDSFNRCLQMEEPSSSLRFMQDCTAIRPLTALAGLYNKLGDYQRAIDCYTKVIMQDKTNYRTLYAIGEALNKLYSNKETVITKLAAYFSSLEYQPNLLLLIDILIRQRLYDYAELFIKKVGDPQYQTDADFLQGKLCFYKRKYEQSHDLLKPILDRQQTGEILKNALSESAQYLFLLNLINKHEGITECAELMEKHCDRVTQKVYAQAANIVQNKNESAFSPDENWSTLLTEACKLLDIVLRAQEFDLFEKLLYLFNWIQSKSVLICLAQIYRTNGYTRLAAEQVMRSVKELDYIDATGIDILAQTLA